MYDQVVYVTPSPGPQNTTYETEFKVRIIDSSGSYIEVYTSATVRHFCVYHV